MSLLPGVRQRNEKPFSPSLVPLSCLSFHTHTLVLRFLDLGLRKHDMVERLWNLRDCVIFCN